MTLDYDEFPPEDIAARLPKELAERLCRGEQRTKERPTS